MVTLTELWLPIVLSAVLVFVGSSVIHMVFTYHRSEYKKLPNEDKALETLRGIGLTPGLYVFPCPPSHKEMGTPEMIEKYKRGPVGMLTVMPSRPPQMGKSLVQWFLFCLLVGVFVAYLAGRTLAPGSEYLAVFRVAGTVALMGYGFGEISASIWKAQAWSATFKHMFDGLVYALLTAGAFGWLWPR